MNKSVLNFDPNGLYYRMVRYYSENKDRINPATGRKSLIKIANNGSSRSSKTYDTIHLIYTFCDHNRGRGLYIGVFRNNLVDCRDNTFKDFKECFEIMGVFGDCDITEYPKPKIKLYGNVIEFMGLPDNYNKQAPRTDILFFNEALEIPDKNAVKGLLMRCEMLAIFDWNPSLTEHWAYEMEQEFNCLYTRTIYKDNKHLKDNVISEIESYCPWDLSDFVKDSTTGTWKWTVPEEKRKPNTENIESGTVDKWRWLVYGEGLPTAREGAVMNVYEWIDRYPDEPMDETAYGLDFGYTNDPSVLTRVGRKGKDLYIEYLTYQSCSNPDILFDLIEPIILSERERLALYEEGVEPEPIVVSCESADKYKDVEFVRSLNYICCSRDYDWGFKKIKKPSIHTRLQIVKRFRLHIVKSKESVKEHNNYVYRIIEGRVTNIPVDDYNHGIDSYGYAVFDRFRHLVTADMR